MRKSIGRIAAGAALAGAALLSAGCGGQSGSTTNNGAAALTGATNDFAIGNDASAMETVGSNAGVAVEAMPMSNMGAGGPGSGASGNSTAPAGDSASGGGGAPGGDRGGNTVESNVSGM